MTRSSRSQDTKNRLIDAAIVVIARDGLEEANVKAIAEEAEITPGLLHYHFANKDALIHAAVARKSDEYLAAMDALIASVDCKELWNSFKHFAHMSLTRHRDLFKLRISLSARAMNDPALGREIAETNAKVIDRLAVIIASGRGEGDVSDDDRALAQVAKNGIDGIMLANLGQPDFPLDAVFEAFAKALDSARKV